MAEIEDVAEQILGYLGRHPAAADTLEGVARWWLTLQQLNESVVDVQLALELLKNRGLVVVRRNPDGRTLYMAT